MSAKPLIIASNINSTHYRAAQPDQVLGQAWSIHPLTPAAGQRSPAGMGSLASHGEQNPLLKVPMKLTKG